jgi:hypothetical protein
MLMLVLRGYIKNARGIGWDIPMLVQWIKDTEPGNFDLHPF